MKKVPQGQGGSNYAWAGVLAFAGTTAVADSPIPIGDQLDFLVEMANIMIIRGVVIVIKVVVQMRLPLQIHINGQVEQ